jgi:hypothetical protein
VRVAVTLVLALVFSVVAALRTWTVTFAVDAAALASWLALIRRSAVAALDPDAVPPGRGIRAVALTPLAVVLAAHAAAAQSPTGLLLIAGIVLAAVAVPVTSRLRVAQAGALVAAPVALVAVVLGLMAGHSGGVLMLLLSVLAYAYGYTASGLWWVLPAAVALAGMVFATCRTLLRDTLAAAVAAFATVYVVAFGVLFGLYYNPTLDHTGADVAAQPGAHVLPLDPTLGPGRKSLWIDEAETRLVGIARSTAMWAPLSRMGIVSYELASHQVAFAAIPAVCNAFAVDPTAERLFTCAFFERRIIELDLRTLAETRSTGVDGDRPDGLVRLDATRALVRVEIPGRGNDLRILNLSTMELARRGIALPRPPLVVQNSGLDVDLGRGHVFLVTTGNEISMLRRLDASGTVQRSVTLPGISWEMRYSPRDRAVYVATLDRHVLYRVDDETFDVTALPAPNAIRGIHQMPNGFLALSDYVRGKVYVYDPREARVLRTLLVGAKPEGLAIGPVSGALYVYSGAGIVVFDRAMLGPDASVPGPRP